MPRPRRPASNTLKADWPEDPCDDPTAEIARSLVVGLVVAPADRTPRSLNEPVGIDRTTLSIVLGGPVWPDIATLARLEAGLAADPWPGRVRPAEFKTVST